MKLHKEGTFTIVLVLLSLLVLNYFASNLHPLITGTILVLSFVFFIFILRFFRVPNRQVVTSSDAQILAPCDGKVVVIERVKETEYFKEERIQISIFMSPNNVHANWAPVDGEITYCKYHLSFLASFCGLLIHVLVITKL